MNAQARVGVFTLLALAGIFLAYYFVTNFSLQHNGYRIGVRFHDVGGLQVGSSVLLSGVVIGEVESVSLLPDENVEVICSIAPDNVVYRHSRFSVAVNLTGSTTLAIDLPRHRYQTDILPKYVLPEDQQPWGTLPPTIADLVSAGQEQLKLFSKTMTVVNAALPSLARRFNSVAEHTDLLVLHTDATLETLSAELTKTVDALNETITVTSKNLEAVTGNVNGLVADNRSRLNELIKNLAGAADGLNKTMAGMSSIAQDPLLHASLLGAAQNMQAATEKLKAITTDVESITGDPATQSELRGAIHNLDAATARANQILGVQSTTASAGSTSNANASPEPQSSGTPQTNAPSTSHSRLFQGSLVTAHIRETWNSHGGGPDSDLNVDLLPAARTHVTFGANDLGYSTSYNVLLDKSYAPDFQVAGGVLYSKLGLAALFRPFSGPVGVDARLYDPKHPTLDLYGDLRLTERLRLFYGERSIWGPTQKTPAFGLQVDY
jgi:phospholipid/cholesterol/gamma-HCH transport system substrate-binding protein